MISHLLCCAGDEALLHSERLLLQVSPALMVTQQILLHLHTHTQSIMGGTSQETRASGSLCIFRACLSMFGHVCAWLESVCVYLRMFRACLYIFGACLCKFRACLCKFRVCLSTFRVCVCFRMFGACIFEYAWSMFVYV